MLVLQKLRRYTTNVWKYKNDRVDERCFLTNSIKIIHFHSSGFISFVFSEKKINIKVFGYKKMLRYTNNIKESKVTISYSNIHHTVRIDMTSIYEIHITGRS